MDTTYVKNISMKRAKKIKINDRCIKNNCSGKYRFEKCTGHGYNSVRVIKCTKCGNEQVEK